MTESTEWKSKLAILSLTGAVVGMLVCLAIYVAGVFSDANMANRWAFSAQFIGSGLYGAICMGGSIIYSIEHWSLWRATVTHFLLVVVSFFIADRLLGWGYFSGRMALPVLAIYTLAYLLIWLIMYLRYRNEVRRINQDLKRIQHKDPEEHP